MKKLRVLASIRVGAKGQTQSFSCHYPPIPRPPPVPVMHHRGLALKSGSKPMGTSLAEWDGTSPGSDIGDMRVYLLVLLTSEGCRDKEQESPWEVEQCYKKAKHS